MQDYLSGMPELVALAGAPPSMERFAEVRAAKQASYSPEQRALLVDVLKAQNPHLSPSEQSALDALQAGGMVVVTGHQLMAAGGTAFFEFKILKTVALARRLSQEWETPVVPIFWMASEDHDFEEIASVRVGDGVFTWQQEHHGAPVGRLDSSSLGLQLEAWAVERPLSTAQRAELARRIKAYQKSSTLADATRAWVREWAEGLGLLVLDGDDALLKNSAAPIWEAERQGRLSQAIEQQTTKVVAAGYRAQVFPRPINLFHFKNGQRLRVLDPAEVPTQDYSAVSPNALLRPVYQEWVLPNLAYVGGGGELAYWFQLGAAFETLQVPMPLLYLRDSVAVSSTKAERALAGASLQWEEVFRFDKEALLKDRLGYYTRLREETAELGSPLEAAVDQWNETLVKRYPELQQHAAAFSAKMRKLNERTTQVRYRAIKKQEHLFLQHVEAVYNQIYPGGVFWERRASYLDLMGDFDEDPRDRLLAIMSAIQAGTHIIKPEKV